MNYPAPQQQPPLQPLKKKGGGCLLFLAIGGGVMVLAGIVIMVIAWKYATSPDGQTALGAGKAVVQGLNAPGTTELRALGCSTAMVLDAANLKAASAQFADGGKPEYDLQISCGTKAGAPSPTCQQVSDTYRAAVKKPATDYLVSVGDDGMNENKCWATYRVDGLRIGGSE